MTEEDEAFNEIERMSSVRQEILRTLNRKRQIQEAERAFDEQYLIWKRNQAESEGSMKQDEMQKIWEALRSIYGDDMTAATLVVLTKDGETAVKFTTITFPQGEKYDTR